MPQLNGGGGDDLGANDEMISFKDEGEQEEKISENVSAERDLDDVKSSLVNESENNSSSSDSEVRTRLRTANVLRAFKVVKVSNSFFPSPCIFSRGQQAERRPQTRPDSESYEKTRDYFTEGTQRKQPACVILAVLYVVTLRLTLASPHSTEKAARWWPL